MRAPKQADPRVEQQLEVGLVLLEAWRRSGAARHLAPHARATAPPPLHQEASMHRKRPERAGAWDRLNVCIGALYRPPGTYLNVWSCRGVGWQGTMRPLLYAFNQAPGQLDRQLKTLHISWRPAGQGDPAYAASADGAQEGAGAGKEVWAVLRARQPPELGALRASLKLRLAPFAASVLEEPVHNAVLLDSLSSVLQVGRVRSSWGERGGMLSSELQVGRVRGPKEGG